MCSLIFTFMCSDVILEGFRVGMPLEALLVILDKMHYQQIYASAETYCMALDRIAKEARTTFQHQQYHLAFLRLTCKIISVFFLQYLHHVEPSLLMSSSRFFIVLS